MKRFLSVCCSALVLLTMIPVTASAVAKGDVNNDGRLSIADATHIQRVLAEVLNAPENFNTSADFNNNGQVTVEDVTLIQRFLAGGESWGDLDSTSDQATKPESTPDQPAKPESTPDQPTASSTEATESSTEILTTQSTQATQQTESEVTTQPTSVPVVTEPSEVVYPQILELDKLSLKLGVDESYKLNIKSDVPNYKFIFYSSNHTVAKVNGSGEVTAVSEGSAQIVCMTDNGLLAFCSVVVMPMANSVSFDTDEVTLGLNEDYTFNCKLPDNTTAFYKRFESDNSNVLSVDAESGNAKANGVGVAIVTCSLVNGANAKCIVSVKPAPKSLELNKKSATLKVGEELILSANTNSGSYSNSFTCTISDEKIAKVEVTENNKIKVFAKMQGTAKITVKAYNNVSAECSINVSGSIVKCLDVSYAQGNIDFEKVKLAGFDYVIIRAGFGDLVSQKDEYFEQNYAKAKAAGLKVGAYWFSYSMSVTNSGQEAEACLKCIEGKEFDLPIYYDMEYEPAIKNLGRTTYNNMASTFCERIRAAGYTPGIYASASVLYYPLNYDEISSVYSIWNAEWSDTCTVKCDMWQYTESNRVYGIDTYVDTSYMYNLNIVS